MPSLLHALDDTVEVEYGQFVVQEVSMLRNPLTLPVPAGEWVAVGGPGGVLLHSAANDHYPAVRLELRDGVQGAHHARVHAGNQDQAAELDEGTFETGVERWLIQLWPA